MQLLKKFKYFQHSKILTIVVAIILGLTTNNAATPAFASTTSVVPTFVCIGGVPCTSPAPAVTGRVNPTVGSSPTAGGPTNPVPTSIPNPTIFQPCPVNDINSIQAGHRKIHRKNNGTTAGTGFLQRFIEFLMKFLEMIFKLLGIPFPTQSPTPGPTPTTVPNPSVNPSTEPTQYPHPTTTPCPPGSTPTNPAPTNSVPTIPAPTVPLGGTSTCPPYPAHPDGNCTGIPAGTTLTDATLDPAASGVTYTNKRFTNSNTETITGSNLTFTNCYFPHGATFRGGTNLKVTHSEFVGGVAFSSYHTVNFSNNNVRDFDDGIHLTSDSGSTVSNITIVDNWIHHPTAKYPAHSDGFQIRGVAGITIRHNTLDMGAWYLDNGESVLNAALFFEDANGGNSGITATNNYFNGGGFALYATGGSGSITNNTFGPDAHFGFVYSPVDSRFTRSGNVDYQGRPVNF